VPSQLDRADPFRGVRQAAARRGNTLIARGQHLGQVKRMRNSPERMAVEPAPCNGSSAPRVQTPPPFWSEPASNVSGLCAGWGSLFVPGIDRAHVIRGLRDGADLWLEGRDRLRSCHRHPGLLDVPLAWLVQHWFDPGADAKGRFRCPTRAVSPTERALSPWPQASAQKNRSLVREYAAPGGQIGRDGPTPGAARSPRCRAGAGQRATPQGTRSASNRAGECC